MSKRSREIWYPKIYLITGFSCTGKTTIGMELLRRYDNTVFLEEDDYIIEPQQESKNYSILSNGAKVPNPITENMIDWNKLNDTIKMYMGFGWNVIITSSFVNACNYIKFYIYKLIILMYKGNEKSILRSCFRRRKYVYGISLLYEETDILMLSELSLPLYNKNIDEMINASQRFLSLTSSHIIYVTDGCGKDLGRNIVLQEVIKFFKNPSFKNQYK